MRQINLLPPELRRDPGLEGRRALQRAFLATVALVLVTGSVGLWYQVYSLQHKLATVQSELVRVQPVVLRVQKTTSEITAKEQDVARMQAVYNERLLWGIILDSINDRSPRDIWLTLLKADEKGSFKITGMARSLTSIGIFQNQLNLLPEIEGIVLVFAEKTMLQDIPVVRFEMTGRLQ